MTFLEVIGYAVLALIVIAAYLLFFGWPDFGSFSRLSSKNSDNPAEDEMGRAYAGMALIFLVAACAVIYGLWRLGCFFWGLL